MSNHRRATSRRGPPARGPQGQPARAPPQGFARRAAAAGLPAARAVPAPAGLTRPARYAAPGLSAAGRTRRSRRSGRTRGPPQPRATSPYGAQPPARRRAATPPGSGAAEAADRPVRADRRGRAGADPGRRRGRGEPRRTRRHRGRRRDGTGGAAARPAHRRRPRPPTRSTATCRRWPKGDAQTARSRTPSTRAVDTTYMTPEVLAASAKRGADHRHPGRPLRPRRHVGRRRPTSSAHRGLDLVRRDEGQRRHLEARHRRHRPRPHVVQDSGIPMLMNGTKVKPGPFSVLPGAYRFTHRAAELRLRLPARRSSCATRPTPRHQPDLAAVSSKGQGQRAGRRARRAGSSAWKATTQKPRAARTGGLTATSSSGTAR